MSLIEVGLNHCPWGCN